jgi:chromosome segregation ATPase
MFWDRPSASDVQWTQVEAQLADIQARLARIEAGQQTIAKQENSMALNVSTLTAAVAKLNDAEASALKLIQMIAVNQQALAQQLKDAIAANDPAALAAVQQAIDDSAAQVLADADALSAAVVANTPAGPQPPSATTA